MLENRTLRKLEKLRSLMIKSGLKYGFQNEKTILLSEKLDELIHEYYSEKQFSKNK